MKATDVVTAPFQWGAALRHRKVFHPSGVVVTGELERLAPPEAGLPMESGPVVARFSKGIGLPGALPDIAGLAWRMSATDEDTDRPWDLLLVSVAHVPLGRVLLRPIGSWSGARFSTLMPLKFHDETWWVRARTGTDVVGGGLSLATLARHVRDGGVEVHVDQARGTAEFEPLARMTLTALRPGAHVSFDPVRNEAPGVTLTPGWLTDLRRAAYRRSRKGRDAE